MKRTPIAKILPPDRSRGVIDRPALSALVSTVLERRLTVVVAEAGFGKSTLLTDWWEVQTVAWFTADRGDLDAVAVGRSLYDALTLRVPDLADERALLVEGAGGPEPEQLARADALGVRLAETLHEKLTTPLILVVDDLHELVAAPCIRLVEALCRHTPPLLHIVLAGRRRPAFPTSRLRGQGQLLEIGADLLAFSREETAALVEARLGEPATSVAGDLHRLAGGWPAALILATEALRASPRASWASVLAGLERPRTPLFGYLAEEVFAHHTDEVRSLVAHVALLEHFSPELCTALRIAASRDVLDDLAAQGLLIERRQDGSLTLRPLIREYALDHLRLSDEVAQSFRVEAADALAQRGDVLEAIRVLLVAGAHDRLVALLSTHGASLLARGDVSTILRACRALPRELRTSGIDQLQGEAEQIQGDWTAALTCFDRAAAMHPGLPAHLAWRIGLIHYLRGEPEAALEVYRRGLADSSAAPDELALLLAWTATAHWLVGDVEACRPVATRALTAAQSSGDGRALAAAHTVMAMLAALDGDRRANDAHYLLALRAAESSADVLQAVRIHANRASHFLEEGSYVEALQELEVAVRLGELTSYASFLALSLSNRGETKLRMGRLDEALTDFAAARARYEEIGSNMVAYALAGIAEVHRERGNLVQARRSFEEALEVAERSRDVQGLAPALSGLATVVAVEDPESARALADRAVACGAGLGYVSALLARGWVALLTGDRASAAAAAREARTTARARRDRAGVADALSLAAMSTDDSGARRRWLGEAAALWQETGNVLGEAKVHLALATTDADPMSVERRRRAERQLESLGVPANPGANTAAGLLAFVARDRPATVRIQSLGGFAVLRGDHLVRLVEWQSRRARELLKLLVARRGRPATRHLLMEALWPGEDPERVSNRLSVALSTIRGILDPDRRFPPETFIRADADSVALDRDALDIDLERFLATAAEGLTSLRRGATEQGLATLEAATVAYTGDFLEENAYDDWAAPAREEARAAFMAAARALAEHMADGGDPDEAVPYFLRILAADRYDEDANVGLVRALARAGRYGEAHRHHLTYRRAMDEIGVEPVPFPAERGATATPTAGTFTPP